MRTPEKVTKMTNAEKAHRLNEVQVLADVILDRMDLAVFEAQYDADDVASELAHNRALVKRLLAMARELGKDFSSVTR